MNCSHCHEPFTTTKAGKELRIGLERNLPHLKTPGGSNKTIEKAIKELTLEPPTPGKLLCQPCVTLLGRAAKLTQDLQQVQHEISKRSGNVSNRYKRRISPLKSPLSKNSVKRCRPGQWKSCEELGNNTFNDEHRTSTPFKVGVKRVFDNKFGEGSTIHSIPGDESGFCESTALPKRCDSFTASASEAIVHGNYLTCLNLLHKKSKKFRRQLSHFIAVNVRKEMGKFVQLKGWANQQICRETVEGFRWSNFNKEVNRNLPLLQAALEGALVNQKNQHMMGVDFQTGNMGKCVPARNLMLTMMMKLRNRNCKFMPAINSMQMYISGCSQNMLSWFSEVGLCLGVNGTRSAIDSYVAGHDHDIKLAKVTIEKELGLESTGKFHEKLWQLYDSDSDSDWEEECDAASEEGESTESEVDESDDEVVQRELFLGDLSTGDLGVGTLPMSDDEGDGEIKEKHPGYCLVWDNVQKLSQVRHFKANNQNTMMLWAMCFGVINRIGFRNSDDSVGTVDATTISLKECLPHSTDWDMLHHRMVVLVMRILAQYFPHIGDASDHVLVDHIPHQFSKESSQKSNIINLGTVKENPSSGKGVTEIMKALKKYVPRNFVIPVHGDQLSVERMITSRLTMSFGGRPEDRLDTLEPIPAEFHKRMLLLEDMMKLLYKPKSVAEKGSLYYVRNKFGHRGVTVRTKECVNHTVDLTNCYSDSLICLLVMDLEGTEDLSEKPHNCPLPGASVAERDAYLRSLAKDIVDRVWPQVDQRSIDQVSSFMGRGDDEGGERMCSVCHEDKMETQVYGCSSGISCTKGRFFHLECVDRDDTDMIDTDEDWWCCTECEELKLSKFCICHTFLDSVEMVECSLGTGCYREQWYHPLCINMMEIPEGTWYCSTMCGDHPLPADLDHKQEYCKAMVWYNLLQRSHTDAERENDGPAMISLWRIVLPLLFPKHNKYLILAHRLLMGMAGYYPPRVREEVLWNRTANLAGGPGRNLALDLVNEFLNNDFKTNLKHCRGQYTERQVTRVGRMVGHVRKALDNVFAKEVVDRGVNGSKSKKASYVTDVNKICKDLREEKLWQKQKGRQFKSFTNFSHTFSIKEPEKLGARLHGYSENIQLDRDIMPLN